jgi:hypothetical protein
MTLAQVRDKKDKGKKRQSTVKTYEVCQEMVTDRKVGRPSFHDTEMLSWKTVCSDMHFRSARKCFNKRFICVNESETELVRISSVRTNSGYRSCTFTCGCNNAPSTLQFRLYFGAVTNVDGEERYIFQVFVEKKTVQESLVHFVSTDNHLESTKTLPLTVEEFSENYGQDESKEPPVSNIRNSSITVQSEQTERKILYIHHHVKNFFEIPVYTKGGYATSKGMVQFIADGGQLNLENIKNGKISLDYPICVTDSATSIGMEVIVPMSASRKSKGKKMKGVKSKIADHVRNIASIVGLSTPVTVINVKDQEEIEGWTIGNVAEYFEDEERLNKILKYEEEKQQQERGNEVDDVLVLNQVSFEFSCTNLEQYVKCPRIVRELDWISNAWPVQYQVKKGNNKGDEMFFPIIQYYCLTSSVGAYMDFHIDVGGTSFWYYIVSGSKQFILIEPTNHNLKLYECWSQNEEKKDIFFPNLVKDKSTIIHLLLNEKETIIVPSGWIHAVYTGMDTLVFGGNFLHGYAIEMQIKINELEVRSNVMEKFRCPYFNVTYIFAANMYLKTLQSTTEECTSIISKRELDQIPYLVEYIRSEYNNSVRLQLNGRLSSASASYNTVYEEPNFELAVQYVFSEHNCSTLIDFLKMLLFAMADAMQLPHSIAIKKIEELRKVAASL